MILLTLSRGNEHERVHLRLPASPAEIGEAFVILDGISLDTTTTATLIQIPLSIEEASISLGASKMKTFFRITVPMMSSGIISGAILSWVSIVTEVSSAAILYNNRSITLTVGTYTAVARGNFGEAAAFAAVTTVLTAISLMAYMRINRGREIQM